MEEVFILNVKEKAVMRSLWIIFQYLLKPHMRNLVRTGVYFSAVVKMECPTLEKPKVTYLKWNVMLSKLVSIEEHRNK